MLIYRKRVSISARFIIQSTCLLTQLNAILFGTCLLAITAVDRNWYCGNDLAGVSSVWAYAFADNAVWYGGLFDGV